MSSRDRSLDPKIIESAKNEFLRKGFINASLKEIALNANVTTGAIYRRYSGKEELFIDVIRPALEMFDGLMERGFEVNEKRMSEKNVSEGWTKSLENLKFSIKEIYKQKELVQILLTKSEGTIYSNYLHNFIEKNFSTSYKFMEELEKKGMCKLNLTYMEYHILLTSFWMSVMEIVIHDFTLEEALSFSNKINLFFAWDKVIELYEEV